MHLFSPSMRIILSKASEAPQKGLSVIPFEFPRDWLPSVFLYAHKIVADLLGEVVLVLGPL